MDTFQAITLANVNRASENKVFDWNEAARRIKESGTSSAAAGLRSDWDHTGGLIFSGYEPIPEDDTYVYLASSWATPELDLQLGDGPQDCYIMQSEQPSWNAGTYWPDSALEILKS